MKPHKHAAAIRAWADGNQIEQRRPGGQWEPLDDIPYPAWRAEVEYRVKQQPQQLKGQQ